jgi:FtsH-binding integral membrane protein
MNNSTVKFSELDENEENKRFLVKVYGWMSVALAVSGIVSFWIANNNQLITLLFENRWLFTSLLILELILVAFLVGWIMKMTSETAGFIFILYSVLNGFTLSSVFIIYTTESLASTFFITAGTFIVMSAYGFVTKTDLTKFGNLLLMGLIGLIIAQVINIFYLSQALNWIITIIGILIFVGLIAYDTQKIKNLNRIGNENTDEDKKEAIIGALILYLDFINLFLYLLRLLGRRK